MSVIIFPNMLPLLVHEFLWASTVRFVHHRWQSLLATQLALVSLWAERWYSRSLCMSWAPVSTACHKNMPNNVTVLYTINSWYMLPNVNTSQIDVLNQAVCKMKMERNGFTKSFYSKLDIIISNIFTMNVTNTFLTFYVYMTKDLLTTFWLALMLHLFMFTHEVKH